MLTYKQDSFDVLSGKAVLLTNREQDMYEVVILALLITRRRRCIVLPLVVINQLIQQ